MRIEVFFRWWTRNSIASARAFSWHYRCHCPSIIPPSSELHISQHPEHQHCATRTCTSKLYADMAEQSIRSLYSSAEKQRKDIEASWDSNTATYQQNVAAAIATYDDCLKLADRLSLFSPNETLEDLTSGDLQ